MSDTLLNEPVPMTKDGKTDATSGTDSGYSSSGSDAGLGVEAPPSTADILAQTPPPTAPVKKSLRQQLEPRFWSVLVLAGLAACAPLVITATLAVVALHRLFGTRAEMKPFNGKVAIVSGGKMTKSYVMIRHLKAQGCRVVLVETHKYWMVASRFSRFVDRFVTVPVPEKDPDAYLEAMRKIAAEEKADIFVPVTSPVASQYEARVKSVLPEGCYSWSLDPATVEQLDDKVVFCQLAEAMGLSVPSAHRMCSHADVIAFNDALRQKSDSTRYIFKNLQYDSMHRLDLFTVPCEPAKLLAYLGGIHLDEANPWTCQTFCVGQEYSTCALASNGRLLAFTDNEATISCFNYTPARNPRLRAWVEAFVKGRHLSGIACFDFIVEADGTPYAIECNPRASSNLANFYNHPGLGLVLAHPEQLSSTVEPLPDAVETYWLFSEVWAALTKPGLTLGSAAARVAALAGALAFKKDAYFNADDPLPFVAQLTIHLPMLLLRNLYTGNKWAKIDPCIGKLTEENGD